jgi:guanylate kinase
MARRLETARAEIRAVDQYDYVLVNDDLERCVSELAAIVTAERARNWRQRRRIDAIRQSFESRPDRDSMIFRSDR